MIKTIILLLVFLFTLSCTQLFDNKIITIFNFSKNTIENEFIVSESSYFSQSEPVIKFNVDGNIIFSWSSIDNLSSNIYIKIYDKKLNSLTAQIKVNSTDLSTYKNILLTPKKSFLQSPEITLEENGNFVISWSNDNILYLRKFDKYGNYITDEITPKILGNKIELNYIEKNILFIDNKYLIKGNKNKYQFYDYSFKLLGNPLDLKNIFDNSYLFKDKKNNIFILSINSTSDKVFLSKYDKNLNIYKEKEEVIGINKFTLDNTDINIDNSSLIYLNEKINKGITVDIYNNENIKNKELIINSLNYIEIYHPILSTKMSKNSKNDFVVVWGEENFSDNPNKTDINARLFNKNFNPIDKQFKVDFYYERLVSRPQVVLDEDGTFIISWIGFDENNFIYQIYAKKYNFYENIPDNKLELKNKEKIDCISNNKNIFHSYSDKKEKIEIIIKDKYLGLYIKDNKLDLTDINKINDNNPFIKINNKIYWENFNPDITLELKKGICFDYLKSNFNGNYSSFSRTIHTYNPYDINLSKNEIYSLLDLYDNSNNLRIKKIEFSSFKVFYTFLIYLKLKIQYEDLFKSIYLSGILSAK